MLGAGGGPAGPERLRIRRAPTQAVAALPTRGAGREAA